MAEVILQVNESQQVFIEKKHDSRFDPELIDGLQSGHFELDEGEYIVYIFTKD